MACEWCVSCGILVDLDCTDGNYVNDKYYCENCYIDSWVCADCGEVVDNINDLLCGKCKKEEL